MSIERFTIEEDKHQYMEWRNRNPEGFVLNINNRNPKSTTTKNIIHSARTCRTLETPPSRNRSRPITPKHPKLCSTDYYELVVEMKAKNLPYKECGFCMK
ncbi:hypothetical protein J23TS9_42560 [Paenibacillus sp. J23TS9]|nr:hypothetical protein J23TS9_42560 [Paenibacillus sp. J23TS9]